MDQRSSSRSPPPVSNPPRTSISNDIDENLEGTKTYRNRSLSGGTKVEKSGLMRSTSPFDRPLPPLKKQYDLDDYFSGPLDPTRHSRLPHFLRLHGSIMPLMILPMIFVSTWATVVTVLSKMTYALQVDPVLLTVLGFVVGLSLSFRSSTAYERYIEGRKFWQQLILHSRNLSRVIWVHIEEREGEEGKEDLLAKLSTINLILAFAQSVKHKLRHELEYDYEDLKPLVENLSTYAKSASYIDTPAKEHNRVLVRKLRTWGSYLGVTFLMSNPRKEVKKAMRAGKHHGNLPLEIMTHISSYLEHTIATSKTLTVPCWQSQVSTSQLNMMDAYGGCERVLQTPLPLAYSIAISQITWLYVLMLPFQLFTKLGWATIPGTIVAAYIILGLAAIGLEIENPFGRDVNDLDLDRYCEGLRMDLNVLTSLPPPKIGDWAMKDNSMPLWPYSPHGYNHWKTESVEEIRKALSHRVDHQAVLLMDRLDSAQRVEEGGEEEV